MKKKELLKRIEELERELARFQFARDSFMSVQNALQENPTTEKFKAIADHANAINDIIKNAPE
jgi:cell division septum initiation protein DivIVA